MSESAPPDRADDDTDVGWGDPPARGDDERLLDERPPHHEQRD